MLETWLYGIKNETNCPFQSTMLSGIDGPCMLKPCVSWTASESSLTSTIQAVNPTDIKPMLIKIPAYRGLMMAIFVQMFQPFSIGEIKEMPLYTFFSLRRNGSCDKIYRSACLCSLLSLKSAFLGKRCNCCIHLHDDWRPRWIL